MPEMTRTFSPAFGNLPYSDPGTPDLRGVRSLVLWLARRNRTKLAVGTLLGVIWMGSQALIPAAVGQAIEQIARGNQAGLRHWTLAVLGLAVVQIVSGIIRHRISVALWLSAAVNVQQIVARKARDLGADLPAQMATGEVVAVTGNDVERVGQSFDMTPRFVGAVTVFAGVAASLIATSPVLGTVVALGVPALVLGIGPLLKPLERREATRREKVGRVTEIAADIVGGLRVLRGIGGEELFLSRFEEASQEVRKAAVRAARVRTLMDGFQILMPGLFILGIIWGGATLVRNGDLQVGELIAFYGMSAFLALPLRAVGHTARIWTAALPAYKRIIRLLTVEPLTHDPVDAVPLPAHEELHDLASGLRIRPGALTVIACDAPETADLLADRLGGYREREQVSLGGVSLASARRTEIRRTILVQDKDPMLLSGTIHELLDIPSAGRISIEQALEAACAQEVIDSLDGQGLDALLVERGRTLSGGQRQRMALARSLLADSPILVLDEPTSAVDSHTEARIAAALRTLRQGHTTVIFSTSPLLLDQADEVHLVIDEQVAATGRHSELAAINDPYRRTVVRDLND